MRRPMRPALPFLRSALLALPVAALALSAAVPAHAQSASFDSTQKAAIEKIVRDYLMEHPEVILQAVDAIRAAGQRAVTHWRALVDEHGEAAFAQHAGVLPQVGETFAALLAAVEAWTVDKDDRTHDLDDLEQRAATALEQLETILALTGTSATRTAEEPAGEENEGTDGE